MSKSIDVIQRTIAGYQNEHDIQITPEEVRKWAKQFGSQGDLILSELANFIEMVYVSKERGKDILKVQLDHFRNLYRYPTAKSFIRRTEFLDLQEDGKSQKEILDLIRGLLWKDYGIEYQEFAGETKRHFIYFDDILATGGTVMRHLTEWLNGEDEHGKRYVGLLEGRISLAVACFAMHSFGRENVRWRLRYIPDDSELPNDAIRERVLFLCHYEIQDHTRAYSPYLNCVIPVREMTPEDVMDYYHSLPGNLHESRAFRKINSPETEILFTGGKNRATFENTIAKIGVDLLGQVKDLSPCQRPLGVSYPSYKTLGTGTLFFTWRNIPNNSPIIFWWGGHGWTPLFPVKNRGK